MSRAAAERPLDDRMGVCRICGHERLNADGGCPYERVAREENDRVRRERETLSILRTLDRP
jgi:hypothetical protein